MNTTQQKRSDGIAQAGVQQALPILKSPTALGLLLLSMAYYVGAQFGFALNFPGTPFSIFWPPNAILMAVLIIVPIRQWWMYLLAVLPAHLVVQWQNAVPAATIAGWYFSNSSEALIGALAMKYFSRRRPQLDHLQQTLVFLFCVVLAAPLLSSFLDAAVVVLTGQGDDYWYLWAVRTRSNALTNLAIVPLILTWGTISITRLRRVPPRRYVEAALLGTALLITGAIIFGQAETERSSLPALLYAPLPLLIWAAVRFGPMGASSALIVVALMSSWNAIHGRGPFSTLSPAENLLSLRLFLIAISVPILLLAALIRERWHAEAALRKSQAALQQSEERFRRAVLDAPIPIMIHADDGEILQINHTWSELTGYSQTDIPTIGDWTEHAYGVRRAVVPANLDRLYTSNGRILEGVDIVTTRSGEQRTWEFSSAPLGRAPDGRRLVVSTAMDITERAQAYQLLEQHVAERTADLAQAVAALQAEVDEHQRTEQALREQEKLFRLTFDQAPIGASMSGLDYRLMRVNDAYCQLTGYTRDELLASNFVAITHPDDREADLALARALVAGEIDQYTLNKRYVQKSGEIIWVHLKVGLVRDAAEAPLYFLGMVEDVTHRLRAEEALQQSEALLRTVIDTIPFLVWGRDRDQRLTFQNAMFSEYFDRQRGDRPADATFNPEMLALWERRNARVLAGETVREETSYELDDGTLIVEEVISPIRDRETISGMVGIWIDITARKRAEQALVRQLRYQQTLASCSRILLGTVESDTQRDDLLVAALQHVIEASEIDHVALHQIVENPQDGVYGHLALLVHNEGLSNQRHEQVYERVWWADLPAEAQRNLTAGRSWGGQTQTIFADHPLLPALQAGDVRRFLVVPVLAGGDWWGTVSFLNSTTERAWDEHELILLQTTAEMIAIFLQRITAEQALHERVSELSALSQIAQALTRWANLPQALDQIRGQLTDLFDAAAITCGILNTHGDGITQLLRVTAGQTTSLGAGLRLTDDRAVREVIERGQATVICNSPRVDLHSSAAAPEPDKYAGCQMLVPVQARDSVIGLLHILAAAPDRSYGATDLELAQTIAGTLANAFENGRLFVNERRQRQFAESLREVATAVTSSLDLKTVVQTIFEQLSQVVRFDGAGLFMPEGDALVFFHGVGRSEPYIGRILSLADHDPAVQVFRERQPQIVNDTTKHPGWVNWSNDDIALSWMGVPLVIGGTALGVLAADHIAPGMYSLDDLRNLQAFADIAAIAIDNAKRYQHAHLAAAEEERRRLAHDLHDSVSQTLFSANLIAGILPELWQLDQQRGQSALADLQRLARGAQAEMRTLLLEMHAPALVNGSLDELLSPLVMSSSAKIASEVDLRLDRAPPLPPDVQIALYRIAQEALNNIVRHSHAQRITVHLQVAPAVTNGYEQPWAGEIRLKIGDNGRGFEPAAAAAQGRFGLVSLRERAAAVGATLELSSQPGIGTQVCAIWSGIAGAHQD